MTAPRVTARGIVWACVLYLAAAGSAVPETVAGRLHALTVFARFQGEGAETTAPEFASRVFAAEQPGSLSHFYEEMSRGQYHLTGECLPEWITSNSPAEAYLPPNGTFATFSREILAKLDAQADLARFDNDGPDGIPDSGDDDGYVDFLFIVTRSAPRDFIIAAATGIAALGLFDEYVSQDRARRGGTIRVRADSDPRGVGGVLQQGASFELAVGSMAHEFGHYLGLVDLYDLGYDPAAPSGPEDDSAGVGYWDLMGHGARGWDDRGGPNPLSAWSLMRLGWLGRDNSQLVVLSEDRRDAELTDVNAGGKVYRLQTRMAGVYYLVEYRGRGTSFYERRLPAEGVLIWRVDESRGTNNDELGKRVDLVCADGAFADAGAPLGMVPDPDAGRDNLDFWAHDDLYRQNHAGNLGDAGDPFDGVKHTELSVVTNPAAVNGIAVERIHRQGQGMVADLRVRDRRRAGPISGDEVWSDTVEVVGDVEVPLGSSLRIASGAVVRVGADRLHTGLDSARVEVTVAGGLTSPAGSHNPAIITSAAVRPAPGDWFGVVLGPLAEVALRQVWLQYPVHGLATAGTGLRRPLELDGVVVRQAQGDGIVLEGVEQTVELVDVQVHGSGGMGIRVEGVGLTRVVLPHLTGNRSGGLERRGGYLECRDGRFADNGLDAADGASLVLGEEVFGEVSDNLLSGGVGVRCLGTQEVVLTGNQFDHSQVGLVSLSAVPRVTGNRFTGPELVARIEGYAVPARFDLNVVQEAERLIDNRVDRAMTATNNWWGRIDEAWIAARMSGEVTWRPYLNFDPRREIGFSLEQNYPNPFNGSTVIGYTVGINAAVVAGRARTVLEVRSIAGGLVRRLVDQAAAPGIFTATWDGRDESGAGSASGVYYLQLQVGPLREVRSLLLLK